MLDSTQPLGLPAGSVRAIVWLFLTGAVVGASIRGIALDPALMVSWQAVSAAYLGTRGWTGLVEAKAAPAVTVKK